MRQLRRSIRRSRARRFVDRLLAPTMGVGLFFASSSGAFAQSTAQAPQPADKPADTKAAEEDISLPGVDVRGEGGYRTIQSPQFKLPDLLKDTPQSITVVPEQLMREQAVYSLRDALRNVTGISIAAGEGGGAQGDNLTLRGFSARNDIFVDGVRDIGQYSRDTFNLESVEVLKGPSSVLFGRGSTGGVINQVSKAPQLTPSYIGTGTVGEANFLRGTLDLNQPLGDTMAARLNIMATDGGVTGRDEVHIKRKGIAPSFAIGLGTPTRLTVSYYYLEDENIPDYGFPYVFGEPANVDRKNYYGLIERDHENDHVHIGTVRLEHAFNDNISVRNTFRYAFYDRDAIVSTLSLVGTPAPGTPLANIRVNRAGAARVQEDSSTINTTEVKAAFTTFGFKHLLVGGFELGYDTSDIKRSTFTGVPPADLLNPNPRANLGAMRRVTNFRGETDAFSFGVFAVDEMTIVEWLKLLAGVRYERFDADFENRFLAQKFSRLDTSVDPRFALVVLPTKEQTYYFSYGTSFNPSAEALSLAVANANTDPESNESFEVGAKFDLFDGALGLRAALFQTNKTNARTTDPALGVQVLEGKQRVRGFEIEGQGRPLPGWNIFAGYTYLDSRVLEALEVVGGIPVKGKRVQNVPENTFSLWTTYDYDFFGKWQIGGGVIYVDQRFANNTNVNRAPAYARGDLTLAYSPWKQFEARMNVQNVSNETYFDAVHPSHIIPGAGRTILFTGTLRF